MVNLTFVGAGVHKIVPTLEMLLKALCGTEMLVVVVKRPRLCGSSDLSCSPRRLQGFAYTVHEL